MIRDRYLRSVFQGIVTEATELLRNSVLEFKPFYDIVYDKVPKVSITLTKEECKLYDYKK